jgi:hypothetical protein
MQLRFGQKLFGQFIVLKLGTKFHPKTADVDFSDYQRG